MGKYLDLVKKRDQRPQEETATRPPTANRSAPRPAPAKRPSLPQPLDPPAGISGWEAWTPFMLWLLENLPDYYYVICDLEDQLNQLERKGQASGRHYEVLGKMLAERFEAARQLAMQEQVRVWTH